MSIRQNTVLQYIMRKLLVTIFSHPRDHPTETQIQSQITSLSQKKKAGLAATIAAVAAAAMVVAANNNVVNDAIAL